MIVASHPCFVVTADRQYCTLLNNDDIAVVVVGLEAHQLLWLFAPVY
jgi:hypothetical protein